MRKASLPSLAPSEYQVRGDFDGPTPSDPEQLAALRRLAEVLNLAPDPIAACVADLTDEDARRMLARIDVRDRRSVLEILKMRPMVPHKVGIRLGADVRAAMGRVQAARRRTALEILTVSARCQVLFDVSRQYDKNAQPHSHKEGHWTDAEFRICVWANLHASVDSAYVWQWAAERTWWLPSGIEADRGEMIQAAAAAVVVLLDGRAPGFLAVYPGKAAEQPDEVAILDKRETSASAVPKSAEEVPIVDAVVDSKAQLDHRDIDDVARTIGQLSADFAGATYAAASVLDQLSSGARPSDTDLASLSALAERFDSAVAALAALGEHISAPTLAELNDGLARLRAAQGEADAAARQRESVSWLLTLSLPDDEAAAGQVEAVTATVRSLLASATWDDSARNSANALDNLVQFITYADDAGMDFTELANKSERVKAELPTAVGLSDVVALVMGIASRRIWLDDVSTGDPMVPERPHIREYQIPAPAADVLSSVAPVVIDSPTDKPDATELVSLAQDEPEIPSPLSQITDPAIPEPEVGTTDLPSMAAIDQASVDAALDDRANLGALIQDQRYGTAAVVAERLGSADFYHRVLIVAALADAARSETGEPANTLRELLTELSADDIVEDNISRLIAVPALLRAAVVAGLPAAGALLSEVSCRLGPDLGAVADEIGWRAVANVFADGALSHLLSDLPDLEQQLTQAQANAQRFNRTRRLRFPRATKIANLWLAPGELLGTMLDAATNNDVEAIPGTEETLARLDRPGQLDAEIDTLDKKMRSPGGNPLDGAARQDLVNRYNEVRDPIVAWVNAARALQEYRASSGKAWATQQLADMRTAVLTRADGVLSSVRTQQSDPLSIGAARAADQSLSTTFALIEGTGRLSPVELPTALVLTGELLKVTGVTADQSLGKVTVPDGIGLQVILEAVERPWAEAVRAQIHREHHGIGNYILDLATRGQLPNSDSSLTEDFIRQLRADVAQSQQNIGDDLSRELGLLRVELGHARLRNEVSEDQYNDLASLLGGADRKGSSDWQGNLAGIRAQLRAAAELLPDYREESIGRLTAKLEGLPSEDAEKIQSLINAGQLATAEELIYYSESGQPIPQSQNPRTDLADFYPSVPHALPDGITDAVIETVRIGGVVTSCPVLDFSGLSGEAREDAAGALRTWREFSTIAPDGRTLGLHLDDLLPVLRLVGVEARGTPKTLALPTAKERRFLEFSSITINGRSMVPEFGSGLEGRLRTLLVWGQPSEDLLLSYIGHDRSGSSLLVLYFGTLSPSSRGKLARRVLDSNTPIVVLDDAALAYLAARGERQFDATMAITLPFSNVNPYQRDKRGTVAPEMFYGRAEERHGVLRREGTQLVFGGRGLGKSALLRSSAEHFQAESEQVAIYLDLNALGMIGLEPDALWDRLREELINREVITKKSVGRSRPHNAVRDGIRSWLKADSRRRLLILLDESDRFLEADLPEFSHTNRFKEIGQTNDGRAKVVFAGLHTVQRYAKIQNNPFSHFGRSLAIGPLFPQAAYDLVVQPLNALGYRFDQEGNLVNQILGYCSYQPFLLQMFSHQLVKVMHERRRTCPMSAESEAPPYRITESDIAQVQKDHRLRSDVKNPFHETLYLDSRYNVIANILALHGHEEGIDCPLRETELRAECQKWWPTGFEPSRLSIEHFHAYLNEMDGLGILAPNTGKGWRLRTPNVLRMIGTLEEVNHELISHDDEKADDSFISFETRPTLESRHQSPLTWPQLNSLIGDHRNQASLVLGSPATGVRDVLSAITESARMYGDRYKAIAPRKIGSFRNDLVMGAAGIRRIVVSELREVDSENRRKSLTSALADLPTQKGATRSAILIAEPDSIRWWLELFGDTTLVGLNITVLAKYNLRTLKAWSLGADRFASAEKQAQLLRVTGGWPLLVERAAENVSPLVDEYAALDDLASALRTPQGAADFCQHTGLTSDSDVEIAFGHLIEYLDGGGDREVAVEAVGLALPHVNAEAMIEVLCALGVVESGADGKYFCDALAVSSWPYRHRLQAE